MVFDLNLSKHEQLIFEWQLDCAQTFENKQRKRQLYAASS